MSKVKATIYSVELTNCKGCNQFTSTVQEQVHVVENW